MNKLKSYLRVASTNISRYPLKMYFRDKLLAMNNPFGILSFSPQHLRIAQLSPFNLIVHIGADSGQESVFYDFLRTDQVIWIEANPRIITKLRKHTRKRRHSKQVVIHALVSSHNNDLISLNLFSMSGANSIYEATPEFLNLNAKRFATGKSIQMISQTLPSALEKEGWDIKTFKNKLLVIDVEGHELEVLKGCPSDFLKNFDYIMCEVSKIERHINAPVFEEVSAFLKIAGFSIDFEGPREFFDDVLYRRN